MKRSALVVGVAVVISLSMVGIASASRHWVTTDPAQAPFGSSVELSTLKSD